MSNNSIHIVTEKPGWILHRWSENWAKHLDATVSQETDPTAVCNFYVNYGFFHRKTHLDICYFTHKEKEDPLKTKFETVSQQCDWCIAQCALTASKLPKNKTTVVRPGLSDLYNNPITLGVVGRDYDYTDRKRLPWLTKLKTDLPKTFRFKRATSLKTDKMPDFYRSLDYLLILSENEGGPVPLIEALSCGTPVIAPVGVGWCDEFSCIRYDNTYPGLLDVLLKLVYPSNYWKTSAALILNIIEKLCA